MFAHPGHNPQWLPCAHAWTWQPSHAPARPSTTAPKRSLLVSTHRPHCVRRAGSPLAALSLKLDWISFHSRPFLSLVGPRGVLAAADLTSSSWASSSWAVGQRSPQNTCVLWGQPAKRCSLWQYDAFNHQGSSSCILEALQNGIAGV